MPVPRRSNEEVARLLAARIAEQVARGAGRGMEVARVFLTSRVRETLSVPAPRRKLPGGGYRATTRATPGAAPRKLSGKLRQGVFSSMLGPNRFVIGVNARSKSGFNYGRKHELSRSHPHPFLVPTVRKYQRETSTIIGRQVVVGFRRS